MSKLDGLKEGDRVRITFEGTISDYDSSMKVCVTPDNQVGYSWILSDGVTNAPTFQIERIEPPLAVGDAVKNVYCRYHSKTGKLESIIHFDGSEYAVVSGFSDSLGVGLLSEYVRA